jgi:GTPase SAR1 family protein
MLVLGISGSGKSTFCKQLKILHCEGFTETEKRSYSGILKTNTITGIKELAEQAKEMGVEVDSKNRKHVRFFRECTNIFELDISDETILSKIKALWEDPAIRKTWDACKNYQIQVSQLDYLMENIDRYIADDFVPSNEDILRSRQRTTGAHATRFIHNKHMWEVVDVGGQLPERQKWEHVLQYETDAVIFFAGLDEFNMESAEDKDKTKMEVSMDVFKEVMENPLIDTRKTCRILFLNKYDLFEQKLSTRKGLKEFKDRFVDFETYYNELLTVEKDLEVHDGAVRYIEIKFREKMVPEGSELPTEDDLNVYPTCAINTNQMNEIFNAIKTKVFVSRMERSGIRIN